LGNLFPDQKQITILLREINFPTTFSMEKVSPERFVGMQAGNAELQSRLLDLIRGGLVELDLATPQSQLRALEGDFSGVPYFEEFAARMVDAQLGSIAKRIRSLASFKELFPDTWHEKLLDELGALYIFSKAFQHFDNLSENLQDELLAQAGVSTRTSDLFQQQGIKDDWLVLGQIKTQEPSNLTSRRTWLMGKESQTIVLSLEYTFGAADFTTLWLNGVVYSGEAVYYPAAYPLRVAFKTVDLAPDFAQVAGYQTFAAFFTDYSEALAKSPWLPQFPALLTSVTPVFFEKKFLLVDSKNKWINTEGVEVPLWGLSAMSGGQPISVFGEWDGQIFKVLNAFATN
jgi:hypothetical protein